MSEQTNWRWCSKCQVLAFAGDPAPGACAAGGSHDHTGSGDYALMMDVSVPGAQSNWRWCSKCQVLAFAGDPAPGACAAGGSHDHTGSGDYWLSFASAAEISWGPWGTGPLSDSATAGSDGNKCQYQVSLSIQQDGTCNFSGYYENRGDVWWGTAPPQAFAVTMIVLDGSGKGYTFTYSGEIPSAPQQGSVAQWNTTQNCPVIADNWGSIAAKNYATAYWYNSYDESPLQVLGDWVGSALNWLQQNAGTIGEVVSGFETVISAVGALAPDPVSRAPLPAGVPTGAAASAGGSPGLQASATPAGNPTSPAEAKAPIDTSSAAATPGS
jgi:hypothetical protein